MLPIRDGAAPPVFIVPTGAANLASVAAALARAGADPVVTADPRRIARGAHVVLPGVGAFGSAMQRLEELGLVEPLRERVLSDRPLLAICLGMQLLFDGSEESPGTRGLGIFSGLIRRFCEPSARVRIPHMGWNTVDVEPAGVLLRPGAAYFANSYCLSVLPAGVHSGHTRHGDTAFVSAFERGSLLACQFHPELSGDWGRRLIRRWFTRTETPRAPLGETTAESSRC